MTRRRRISVVLGGLALSAALASRASAPLVYEFERHNGTYTGLETVLPPIVRGPLTVRLSSPRYDLEVLANRLELAPGEDCRQRATLWGRFLGEGELVADVELGAFPAGFEDRVRIPEQEKEVEAVVTVEPVETGYRVTLEELPAAVTVRIESDLVGGLVSFCRRVSVFVIGDAGCSALDRALSNPSLSLPEPGTDFVLRRDQLEPDERERLDAHLSATADCAPPAGEI